MAGNPFAPKSRSIKFAPQEPKSNVPEGTINEVLRWVDGDYEKALEALEFEQNNKNRSTLISELESILEED